MHSLLYTLSWIFKNQRIVKYSIVEINNVNIVFSLLKKVSLKVQAPKCRV